MGEGEQQVETASSIEAHRDRPRVRGLRLMLFVFLLGVSCPGLARAADPPLVGQSWATDVTASSARLVAELTPGGASTSYHFDYLPATQYEANLARGVDGFAGAGRAPAGTDAPAGSGTTPLLVSQALTGLAAGTAYRYRVVAKNAIGSSAGPPLVVVAQELAGGALADGRGWEMVSPVDKNGGQVALPETLAGGGVLQAAAQGGSVTYSSAASFGPEAQGAPIASQYLASRSATGWLTSNLTTPMLSGSYGDGPTGAPYQLFSQDLGRGLLLNGRHCREGGDGCPVANPPLPGSGAPAGYQNYYLWESGSPTPRALLTAPDLAHTSVGPEWFDLMLAGSSSDLRQVALSTCAALTEDATEAVGADGCDPEAQNLYLWSAGALRLVNVLPGDSGGSTGSALAAQAGAISEDGNRVYWQHAGNLYLREGSESKQVDATAGGGGTFETASADGAVAYFTQGGRLYRYDAAADSAVDLTPAGGVEGVLGASRDGSFVYYLSADGVFLRHGGTTTAVAADADVANYPPVTGTARVSEDGTKLAFVATTPLTGYDNVDLISGERDSQVYLYDASAGSLDCVSCNPTRGRPNGPSTLPGARANGLLPSSIRSYKPRALAAGGRRLFFDSGDALVPSDTDGRTDVYQWEAGGTGDCTRGDGCLSLISSGRGEGGTFADASASGDDAYFLTAASLVPSDPGSIDLYDARVGGGFPIPSDPIPCNGDACQSLPSPPPDQVVGTLVPGAGNPPVRYQNGHGRKQHRKHKKRHKRHRHHHAAKGKRR
jgi:hypothetical protein